MKNIIKEGIIVLIVLGIIFTIGWNANSIYTGMSVYDEIPLVQEKSVIEFPKNRISEDQIQVYNNKIIINVKNVSLANYKDTNSMFPLLDKESTGIEIIPQTEEELQVGDIVAYNNSKNLIIHRIVSIEKDEQGTFYTLKGDNNPSNDTQKVRFSDIKYVLVGVLY